MVLLAILAFNLVAVVIFLLAPLSDTISFPLIAHLCFVAIVLDASTINIITVDTHREDLRILLRFSGHLCSIRATIFLLTASLSFLLSSVALAH